MTATLETAATELTDAGYKVLRPFVPGWRHYRDGAEEGRRLRKVVFVDVESTGLDVSRDQIVQLGFCSATYDNAGICTVTAPVTYLEAPTVPISDEASAVHGLTIDRLMGERIEDAVFAACVEGASLLVAHNAAFDAPMLVRRFPWLAGKAWACSLQDVDWKARGYPSSALWALLEKHTGHHFAGHDAGGDVAALAHVLATPFADGSMPFAELLTNARAPRVRVRAVGAPMSAKDALKARGYRWDVTARVWWKDVCPIVAERIWLAEHVYDGAPRHTEEALTAATRFAVGV